MLFVITIMSTSQGIPLMLILVGILQLFNKKFLALKRHVNSIQERIYFLNWDFLISIQSLTVYQVDHCLFLVFEVLLTERVDSIIAYFLGQWLDAFRFEILGQLSWDFFQDFMG